MPLSVTTFDSMHTWHPAVAIFSNDYLVDAALLSLHHTFRCIIRVEVRQLHPPLLFPHVHHTTLKAALGQQAERQAIQATEVTTTAAA
jgi:hypothetical protein